jgi:hypothetical protein
MNVAVILVLACICPPGVGISYYICLMVAFGVYFVVGWNFEEVRGLSRIYFVFLNL